MIKVAVPNVKRKGKNFLHSFGVFVEGKGVFQLEVPRGLTGGDEFEIKPDLNVISFLYAKTITIPIPDGLNAGDIFKHRLPNGKTVQYSCPPDLDETFDELLLPWGEFSNEYLIIQAQGHKQIISKQQQELDLRRRRRTAFDDDLELAKALSNSLKIPSNQLPSNKNHDELEEALKASLKERNKEEEELEKVLQLSAQQQQQQHANHFKQDEEDAYLAQILEESRKLEELRAKYAQVDEEAFLERIKQHSLREAKLQSENAIAQMESTFSKD